MKRKDNMPLLVFWGLYGIKSRASAQGFMWLSVLLTLALVAHGILIRKAFQPSALLLSLAAAWYWYAINWVDKHASWDKT